MITKLMLQFDYDSVRVVQDQVEAGIAFACLKLEGFRKSSYCTLFTDYTEC